jgi:hypothetical protein
MATPEHLDCGGKGKTDATGFGLTVTLAVTGVPEQPLKIGVMVKVTITGALVILVKAPLISPVPLSAIPVTEAVLFLVQSYIVPEVLPAS